jgi:hypothetical protein
MAFKLIQATQALMACRERPHLVALVGVGAVVQADKLVERSTRWPGCGWAAASASC